MPLTGPPEERPPDGGDARPEPGGRGPSSGTEGVGGLAANVAAEEVGPRRGHPPSLTQAALGCRSIWCLPHRHTSLAPLVCVSNNPTSGHADSSPPHPSTGVPVRGRRPRGTPLRRGPGSGSAGASPPPHRSDDSSCDIKQCRRTGRGGGTRSLARTISLNQHFIFLGAVDHRACLQTIVSVKISDHKCINLHLQKFVIKK